MLITNTGTSIDNRLRIDPRKENMSEAQYLMMTIPDKGITFIIRYVLFNCSVKNDRKAYISAWFYDREHDVEFIGVKQGNYDKAFISLDRHSLRIQDCGFDEQTFWGTIKTKTDTCHWNLALDSKQAVGIDRLPRIVSTIEHAGFLSPFCKTRISGKIEINDYEYPIHHQAGSCGHYFGKKKKISWHWGNCVNFKETPDCVFEGISFKRTPAFPPLMFMNIYYNSTFYGNVGMLRCLMNNRQITAEQLHWKFLVQDKGLKFEGEIIAYLDEMIMHTHPINQKEKLYTAITYNADMVLKIKQKNNLLQTLHCNKGAAFEVTQPQPFTNIPRRYKV